MKESDLNVQSLFLSQPLDYVVGEYDDEDSDVQVNQVMLIGRLMYAVIVVGFLGYFADKLIGNHK